MKEFKTLISEKIDSLLRERGVEFSSAEFLEHPAEAKNGDISFPCFRLAKLMRKAPPLIANDLASALADDPSFENVVALNGYLNFYISKKYFADKLKEICADKDFGRGTRGNGKTVCLDFSSPNIAKRFHLGHIGSTVIGNALRNMFEFDGYKTVAINYLGDWGTQFGKLITAYRKWSSKEAVTEKGIEELLRIYVKFNTESKNDPALIEEARAWFVKMEQNDTEALEIWKWFKEISMTEFSRVYDLLNISFDSYKGESFYRSKVPALIEELEAKHLLKESQGAKIIDLEAYGMPPCLISKSDGGSIYHSRDIAAILYRKQTYHFDQCLYVTGLEQSLHFQQIFKAVELMGYDWADSLVHVPYGLVSLSGAKLSTRTGTIIYAEDILREAIRRAAGAIQEKNPELPDREAVAEAVGVGAVIFHDLFHQRIKNVDFS